VLLVVLSIYKHANSLACCMLVSDDDGCRVHWGTWPF